GLLMVWYGAFYALLEDNIRRLLAYSIVSQVGYMVVAIGIGTPLALNGAAAHAFAHIIYKALLLMAAGAVIFATDRQGLSQLGGLGRAMPWTAAFATIGAFTLVALPLTSAFASKALITQAAAESQLGGVWFALTCASALAVLYVGLRLPWLVFWDRDSGLRPPEAPFNMRLAMGLLAILCLLLGVWPSLFYGLLPFSMNYQLFTAAHLVAQWQLLLFAALVFFLALPWLRSRPGLTLDLDWFYRRPGFELLYLVNRRFLQNRDYLEERLRVLLARLMLVLSRHQGPYGELARTWPTGSMVLWVAVLLAICLIFYYL
ncbi:MAG: proton-conducting transporter membrane subunit, partial [Candidatus Competibacteraceae bacterium]|nr:proton-conducting transporter membrane subunit [Candidatus Competibacteraceae bacterium]